ncbi:MAG: hypothetical protein P8127_17525 [Acidobacteriota bacterium]
MRRLMLVLLVVSVSGVGVEVALADAGSETPKAFLDPRSLVAGIYDAVSAPSDTVPDWDFIRSHFTPEALIVLRATPEDSRLMNLEAFIDDFESFYERTGRSGRGFRETVQSIRVVKFGNIAHCYVVYTADILGDDRPPRRGLDSWHLMHRDGRWWVVSVINDVERIAGPIPDEVIADN